jgi:hypothetical protein
MYLVVYVLVVQNNVHILLAVDSCLGLYKEYQYMN